MVEQAQSGPAVIHVRVRTDFRDALRDAAGECNISDSDFVRLAVVKAMADGLFNERELKAQQHAGQGAGYIEQLKQLFNGVRWDGDLLSKHHRNELVKNGLAAKANGWNLITEKGVTYLEELGLIQP